jgi:hypothetical protein
LAALGVPVHRGPIHFLLRISMSNFPAFAEPCQPSAAAAPAPPAVRTEFRRNLMDRQDPFETSGVVQRDFTVNGSYKLPPATSAQQLADEIRAEIHESLVRGCVAGAEVEIVDFDDAKVQGEAPRRFVVVRTKTARKTPVNVNAYFQPYGEHLFYSVRSYTAPRLSVGKLVHTLGTLLFVVGPIVFLSIMDSMAGSGSYGESEGGGFPIVPIIVLLALIFTFRKFLRNLFSGDPFSVALRKQFPGELNMGAFDDDDVIAFFKTNLDLTLEAISAVLERHGIDTKALRTIIQNLQTINVHTGGGEIVGAVIGGNGSIATGSVAA